MQVNPNLKQLVSLAMVILVIGLIFIIYRWPQSKDKSFSQHVAIHKVSIIYYILLFSAVLPILILFFFGWFMPTFGLSAWFGFFVGLASITQYACTFIPETGGWKTKYHRILAGTSAISLLPALALVLQSDSIKLVSKTLVLFCLFCMTIIVVLLVRDKGVHRKLLFLQSAYYAAFFAPILIITYLN